MKKSLLALVLAVALAVPVLAENMWVGGSFSYSSNNSKIEYDGGGEDTMSSTSWSIEPEFGYSLNEKWDIGLDLGYESKQGVTELYGTSITPAVDTTAMGIAPFARFHVAQIAGVDVMFKGSIIYAKGEIKGFGESVDYSAYGIAIAPVISYSINETWSIGCTLNFLELAYAHYSDDDNSDNKIDNFGFNVNDGSIMSVGFSYHF
jgi:hypothetical protein